MEPGPVHHCLVRISTTDSSARVQAGERELTGGPTLPDTSGDWWLGEELLAAAAGLSLLSSLHELAGPARLAIGAYRCVAEAVFLLRAEAILRHAKDSSVIAHALTVPIELQVTPMPSGAKVDTAPPR